MGLGCLPEQPALARPTAYRPAYHRPGPLGTLVDTESVPAGKETRGCALPSGLALREFLYIWILNELASSEPCYYEYATKREKLLNPLNPNPAPFTIPFRCISTSRRSFPWPPPLPLLPSKPFLIPPTHCPSFLPSMPPQTYMCTTVNTCTRNFLTFVNATAIAYGRKIDQSLKILVACNSSRFYKRQKIASTVINEKCGMNSSSSEFRTLEKGQKARGGRAAILVLLSQDLPSPFVLVRFARIFLPKRHSVQGRA